jgi:hypothetical protein
MLRQKCAGALTHAQIELVSAGEHAEIQYAFEKSRSSILDHVICRAAARVLNPEFDFSDGR